MIGCPNPSTTYKKEIGTCPGPDLAESSILKINKISAKPRAGIIEAKQAYVEESEIFGVKGPSPFICLPDFDFIDGFVIDSMHCIDLGVTRNFVSMWFDSSNNGESWYVGRHVE